MQAAAQHCLHMMWSKKQTSAAKAKATARGNSLALCLRSPAANLRQALPANSCVQGLVDILEQWHLTTSRFTTTSNQA